MWSWIKKHPGLTVLGAVLLAIVAWLAYRGAFGAAAVVGATGGLAHAVSERFRRQREEVRVEAERQRLEDEAAHERVLTELERRRVADDEIAGADTTTPGNTWDDTDRMPPP